MNIFKLTKESITTKQAAEAYGLNVNRNGMVCCPFHNDKHPSMKVDKGFYCFACGAKGDVIHFVEKFFGISPYEAAKKLANDFGIQVETEQKKSKAYSKKKNVQKKNLYQLVQEFEKWEKYCIRILLEYLHLLEEWKMQYAPQSIGDEWNEKFVEASDKKEQISYYLDILLEGELPEKIEFIRDKGEEVKTIEKRLEEYRRRDNDENGICDSSDGRKLVS